MELTRIFHPVGFGAFYTEKHVDPHTMKYFNIVYDCGTVTAGVNLDLMIQSRFNKGEQIDILFISHFHEDHISGIPKLMKHCRIKRVVIPYIPKGDRVLFAYSNRDLAGYEELITNTENYFRNEAEIIRILPEEESEDNNNETRDEELTMPSGRSITATYIGVPIADWCFIPFNYNYAAKVKQLQVALKAEGLDHSKLDSVSYIKNNYDRIKNVYKNLSGNINDTSLVVFSGMCLNFIPYIFFSYQPGRYEMYKTGLNCIYYGDVNTDKDILYNRLMKRLQNLYATIQTIQIPHHGSKHNFRPTIINPGSISIVCTDSNHKKQYHPDPTVIVEIVNAGSFLHQVTDNVNSIITEYGHY